MLASPQFQIKLTQELSFFLQQSHPTPWNIHNFRSFHFGIGLTNLEPFHPQSVNDLEHIQRHFTSRIPSPKINRIPNGLPFST